MNIERIKKANIRREVKGESGAESRKSGWYGAQKGQSRSIGRPGGSDWLLGSEDGHSTKAQYYARAHR